MSPALLCGGLTLIYEDSWFPHLAAVLAYPLAVIGLIGGLWPARSSPKAGTHIG